MTAPESQPASASKFAAPCAPLGTLHNFGNALRQAVALHPQAVHGYAWRLEQIHASDLDSVNAQLDRKLVELRFKSEADVHRAVSTHSAARRFVGEHAVTVVTNVRDVIERAQQRPGIKNGDYAIRAVGAAIL